MKNLLITSLFWVFTAGLFAVTALALWILIDVKFGSAEILFDWHFNSKRQIVIDVFLYAVGIFSFYLITNIFASAIYNANKNAGRLTLLMFICGLIFYLGSNLIFAVLLAGCLFVNFFIIRKASL